MAQLELDTRQVVQKHTNEVRKHLNEIVESVSEDHQRVRVFRYNEPKAVILSADDYAWLETVESHMRTHDPEWFAEHYASWKQQMQARQDRLRQKRELEQELRDIQEKLRRLNP